MRKRIIQSLTVAAMIILMVPVCIQSESKDIPKEETIKIVASTHTEKHSNLYAGVSYLSNDLLRSAIKETNKITTVRESIPEPVEEIEEETEPETYLSEEDIRLIATVTMAEAESECEYGRRLVIDTILNRMDSERYPDTVSGVIYQKSQFSCMWDGRIDVCYVMDDIYQLVIEELNNRTNRDVMFFRGGQYPSYGTPMFKVGRHYFSSL